MPHDHDEQKQAKEPERKSRADASRSKEPAVYLSQPRDLTHLDRIWTNKSRKQVKKSPTQEVEQLIAVLDRATAKVSARLQAGDIDPQEVAPMRYALVQERTDMMDALVKLPSGSPTQLDAFAAVDRLNAVIAKLDALARAHEGRTATATAIPKSENERSDAREQARPYCDVAPQQQAPCGLDDVQRRTFRSNLRDSIVKARENWKLAIVTRHIEERLRGDGLGFERALGEALLGILFGLVGAAGKALASKGIDMAAKKMTQTVHDDVSLTTWKQAPDADDVALAKGGAGKGIDLGSDLLKGKLKKGGVSAQQLDAAARSSVAIPADRLGFLAVMKSAPDTWADTILLNMNNLFDDDLVSLAVALPLNSPALSIASFEARINDVLDRFQQQVMAVDLAPIADVRPIQIITPSGIRHALVMPEKKPNNSLHGEWRGTRTKTGRWEFVRWIDEDMRDMAVGRAVQQDITSAAFARAYNDEGFWSEKSLRQLGSSSPAAGGS